MSQSLFAEKPIKKLLFEALTGGVYTTAAFAGPYALLGYVMSVDIYFSLLMTFFCVMAAFLTAVFVRRRVLRICVCCGIQLALMVLCWQLTSSFLYPLCFLPLVFRSLYVSIRYGEAIGNAHLLCGAAGIAVCFIVAGMNGWESLYKVFEIIGCAILILSLLLANRRSLGKTVSPSGNGAVAKALVHSNMLLASIATAVIFIVAYIQEIRNGLVAVWEAVKHALVSALLFLAGLLPEMESIPAEPGGEQTDFSGFFENAAPQEENPLMRQIFDIIFYILIAAAAIAVIIYMGKLLCKAFLRVRKLFSDMLAEGNYVEESANLFDINTAISDFTKKAKKVVRRFMRPKSWNSLTDSERVRRAYAVFIEKSPNPTVLSSKTVHEALSGSEIQTKSDLSLFVESYDKVRYGEMEATHIEAENARKLID